MNVRKIINDHDTLENPQNYLPLSFTPKNIIYVHFKTNNLFRQINLYDRSLMRLSGGCEQIKIFDTYEFRKFQRGEFEINSGNFCTIKST